MIQTGTDVADQYILLEIAREVAAEAGEAPTAIRATDELAERFDVSAAKLRADSLLTVANRATVFSQHKAIAEAALDVVRSLADADEDETAISLSDVARSSAQESRQSSLVTELAAKAGELREQQKATQAYREALAVMEDNPAEPRANLTAGRYLCLAKGDWGRGVPYLALGSDAELKTVAVMELRGANSAELQVAIGDAWWTLADSKQG